MQIAIIVTHIRAEEKLLINAFVADGITPDIIIDRDICIDITRGSDQIAPSNRQWRDYQLILERCVSTSRGLYLLAILESWRIRTLNRYETASICADKVRTSLALARANLPQPRTYTTFDTDSTIEAMTYLEYPVVLKPVTGSWGRLLARINDQDAAEAIIEHRQTLGNYMHHIFYTQAYINKPQRDIRAFVIGEEVVCAIYRYSEHWITNTARGGQASNCPITPELEDLCQRAAQAVGGGILAIDLLEDYDGQLLINEINHTMEFRNSSTPTGVNIAGEFVRYVEQYIQAHTISG